MIRWTGSDDRHESEHKGFHMVIRRGRSSWFWVAQDDQEKLKGKSTSKYRARRMCEEVVENARSRRWIESRIGIMSEAEYDFDIPF